MEIINNNDYILYRGMIGKVELILGNKVIANVEGVKVKGHISEFKKWDIDKVNNISKATFLRATAKLLDKYYLIRKYPDLNKSDIEILLTSGILMIQNLKDELFRSEMDK